MRISRTLGGNTTLGSRPEPVETGRTPPLESASGGRLAWRALLAVLLCLASSVRAGDFPVEIGRPASLSLGLAQGRLVDSQTVAAAQGDLAVAAQQRFSVDFGEWNLSGFRTVVAVNGKHPYQLVLEDYPELTGPALVERGFPVAADTQLNGFRYDKGGTDILLSTRDRPTSALRVLRTEADPKTKPPAGMRVGGPGSLVTESNGDQSIVVPAFSARPSYRLMAIDDARDVPVCKWQDGGRILRLGWHDQIDVFTFAADDNGQTRFLFERNRGLHSDEVISFGIEYDPPVRRTGRLLGHWSFDDVDGRTVRDGSGNGFDAVMDGGVRLTPGIVGTGIDGVSCDGVARGELVIPTPEGELPGALRFGVLRVPGALLRHVSDQVTISFWYAMPPSVNGAYHPYMSYWKEQKDRCQLVTEELRIYSYDHWLNGHCITAAALGHHRLFGMIGPPMTRDMWNHYAVVLNGNVGDLYINGELKVQQTGKRALGTAFAAAEDIRVLQNTWARMDELRVYDCALDLEAVQALYRQEGQERITRLSFDALPQGAISEGVVSDDAGNACRAQNVHIVARDGGGQALRFGDAGGSVALARPITQGKPIEAATVAAWIKLPEGYNGRSHLIGSGNHGHRGMFVGFWKDRVWGHASQNGFAGRVTPGEWTHVIWSYGHNRICSWVDGEKVQDNDEAYPSGKGWGVDHFTLSYDTSIEIDDIQIFSFAVSDAQASSVFAGDAVLRPDVKQEGAKEKRVTAAQFGGQQ